LGLDSARLPLPESAALAWAEQVWQDRPGLRVLCVGRMTYYKGHEFLLQALARLDGVQALIVGHGELRDKLAAFIENGHLGGRARLMGFLPDDKLIALMATCQVFCLPSLERTEAFGVVLMEAMRYGKPVIASRIPGSGVGWVARHEENGLLVPPADPAALAEALQRLAGQAELRERLGRAGAARFQAEFDITRVAGRLAEVYRACLT
jgi:rhamnosyl/mannosyltransferase